MKKKHNGKHFPFFYIFNRLSDSVSFTQRLFLSFIFIAIPVMAALFIGSFFFLQTSTHQSIEQTQAIEVQKLNTQLLAIVNDVENVSREMVYNSDVQEFMQDAAAGDPYPEDHSTAYYINGFISNRDYINSIVLTGMNHTLFSTELAYTNVSSFQNIQEKWWFPFLEENTDSYQWYPYALLDTKTYQSQENNEIPNQIDTLMLARPVFSVADYRTQLGYLMIYLDDEYIQNLWRQISFGDTTNVFLMDTDNNIIISNVSMKDYSGILQEHLVPDESEIISWENENYVVTCSGLNHNRWKLCMITPYSEVNHNASVLMGELILMIAVIILILFLMSRYSANNMARPVISLSKLMDTYHGYDDKTIDEHQISIYKARTDEIGQMYRSYEQLEERLNTLIQENYVKNIEKKDAELALLQSQINPHFLYNTLDSINWIALTNGQDEISEMITALSDTFRLSLMKNNSPFTELNQEIRYIQSYLVLQKFRYEDRLTYDFDLPEPLPSIFIPRFILQPIIENALKHGIGQLERGGRLEISISIDDYTRIIILNDGTNINLMKMQRLLAFDPNDQTLLNFENEGYGVQNINRRIKLICGTDYGLTYTKTDSQTVCTILLPVRTSGV
ncbi:sensor histidine kinase [uncultured Eubacterium sp.]|uniref:sensor histidine kinase n=1 Tax=uncultured Eubacterium sp. TaxID=165185 RepID=UPI0025F2EB93|nr:histidine kinase [uncultured Eubacterium sp.]